MKTVVRATRVAHAEGVSRKTLRVYHGNTLEVLPFTIRRQTKLTEELRPIPERDTCNL